MPAKWRELTAPLNEFPSTGKYAFRLAVFAPGMQLDCTHPDYCNPYVGQPLTSISTQTTGYGWNNAGIEQRLADIWLAPAVSATTIRAEEFARWDFDAFPYSNDRSTPLWEGGAASTQIKSAQTKELSELVCRETGMLPYSTIHNIESVLRWSAGENFSPIKSFTAIAEVGFICNDVPDRCSPIETAKVCAGLHAALDSATDKKEVTP